MAGSPSERSLLEEEDPGGDRWVEVLGTDPPMWLTERECRDLGWPVMEGEDPERYLKDPLVLYHADMLHEQGALTRSDDLHDVQWVLLQSHMIRREEREGRRRTADQEFMFGLIHPEQWEAYQARKASEQVQRKQAEEAPFRAPSPQELAADLAALFEKADEEDRPAIEAVLSPEELDQLRD